MNLTLLLSYIIAVIAIIATPGPNAILVIQQSIRHGKIAAIFNAFGGATASFLLILISLIGLHSILSDEIIIPITIVGSLYLIYLGYKNLKIDLKFSDDLNESKKIKNFSFFKESFLVGISNPKDIIFFLIFLPQFIDKNIGFLKSSIILILIWLFLDVLIMLTYGLLALNIRKLSQRKIHLVSKISGSILISIGLIIMINIVLKLTEV